MSWKATVSKYWQGRRRRRKKKKGLFHESCLDLLNHEKQIIWNGASFEVNCLCLASGEPFLLYSNTEEGFPRRKQERCHSVHHLCFCQTEEGLCWINTSSFQVYKQKLVYLKYPTPNAPTWELDSSRPVEDHREEWLHLNEPLQRKLAFLSCFCGISLMMGHIYAEN